MLIVLAFFGSLLVGTLMVVVGTKLGQDTYRNYIECNRNRKP